MFDRLLAYSAQNNYTTLSRLALYFGANPNTVDRYGDPLLYDAVNNGNLTIVEALIDAGAEVNTIRSKRTLLHDAVSNAANSRHGDNDSNNLNNLNIIKALIKGGVKLNEKNNDSETPLYSIAWSEKTDVFKALIDAGVDVNIPNGNEVTPLHLAAGKAIKTSNIETVKLLIEAGANPEAKDVDGKTFLDRVPPELQKQINELVEVQKKKVTEGFLKAQTGVNHQSDAADIIASNLSTTDMVNLKKAYDDPKSKIIKSRDTKTHAEKVLGAKDDKTNIER